jgi:hypothetical protein
VFLKERVPEPSVPRKNPVLATAFGNVILPFPIENEPDPTCREWTLAPISNIRDPL